MEELPPLEHEEQKSHSKKIIIFLGIILMFLILVYSVFAPVQTIVQGFFESSTLDENKIEINSNSNLIFLNNTYGAVLDLHKENRSVELKACLLGEIKESNYFIDSIFYPKIISQTHNQVVSSPCPDETLVDLHSHPYNHCLASDQDLYSFSKAKERNENTIMAIMCEEDRFNFYV
jgi:hypothetical protein